jgi:ADP-heptose:LPS heptosyltransferase
VTEKTILIIHLSRLGDMIQSLPAVKCLKEEHPGSTITYLGIEDFCHLLEDSPFIDNLVTLPWREIGNLIGRNDSIDRDALDRLYEVIPELHKNYDLLINMTHTESSGYLCEKIAAAEKKGRRFTQDNEIIVLGNWAKYLFAIAKNRRDNLLNLADIYVGMAGVKNRPVENFLTTNADINHHCKTHLTNLGLKQDKLSVAFQLGASKSTRMWPIDYFVRLGKNLIEHLDAQVILFGSEQERVLAEQFQEAAPFPFIDLICKTSLNELASSLTYIDILVSNDTGPMHIAAAVGTKVVGIFSGTAHYSMTGPYGEGHVVVQSNYPCAPCIDSTVCSNPLCRYSIHPDAVERGIRLALNMSENDTWGNDSGVSIYKSFFHKNGTLQYELINRNNGNFLRRLRSIHDLKGSVSQMLWNQWLCLESDLSDFHSPDDDCMLSGIIDDFRKACLSYSQIYGRGTDVCNTIIKEFKKTKPDIPHIQKLIQEIQHVEEDIKNLESPLSFFKDIHEFHISETRMCNFPKLAYEFLDKYKTLADIINSFESGLQDSLDICSVEIS